MSRSGVSGVPAVTLSQRLHALAARLRDVELSEGCNVCEGLDSDAVYRIADDLEHEARQLRAREENDGE